ncbi:MAG: hypothetical protein PWQ25_2178 [Deferribacteres bacterium]|jgi:diacylglycerol kinase family enzyme|nr:hypothetical protein [Deferribacteres bacterium]
MKVYGIYNPASGSFDISQINYCVSYFENKYKLKIEIVESKYPKFSNDFFKNNFADLVIVFGGDGFIRDVVEGLYINKISCLVYFIPFGTVNVLCRELKIGTSYKKALNNFSLNSKKLPLNIGLAGDKVFVQMFGIGFDAASVKNVNIRLKKNIGRYAYVISALKNIFGKFDIHQIYFDKKKFQTEHLIVNIGNFYAGSYKIYNKFSDKFKILISEDIGFFGLIKFLIHIFTPFKILDIKLAGVVKIENVTDAQIDGDYVNFDGKGIYVRLINTKIFILKPGD